MQKLIIRLADIDKDGHKSIDKKVLEFEFFGSTIQLNILIIHHLISN